MRTTRHRVLRASVAVAAVGLARATLPATRIGGPDVLAAAAVTPSAAAQAAFRREWGLPSDPQAIALAASSGGAANPFAMPLTQGEVAELFARPTSEEVASAQAFVDARPALFGGLYVDQAAAGQVVIEAAPGGAPLAIRAGNLLPPGVSYRIESVERPESLLQSAVAQITNAISSWAAQGVKINEVEADIPGNAVVVGASGDYSALAADSLSRFGPWVQVVQGEAVRTSSCTQDSCPPPWRGGTKIISPYGGCTLGYIARDTSGAGQRFAVTAGHCSEGYLGVTFTQGSNTLGNVVNAEWTNYGSTDSEIVQIDPTKQSNWLWWSTDGKTIDTQHTITSASTPSVGAVVCNMGAMQTLALCGHVLQTGVTVQEYNGPLLVDQVHADYLNWSGNSGGPVLNGTGHQAYGIHVAGGNYSSYFSLVTDIDSVLHVWICMNSSCS
ncbi:MAG: S1 family peptidase [Candidatus Limnocylindrales bacterium]